MSEHPTHTADPSLAERFPGLTVLEESPANAEQSDRPVHLFTPRPHHYVRSHYPTPDLDTAGHAVSVTGQVEREGDLSMEALREEFPTVSHAHTMECSGNGRSGFEPDASGHQWTEGALGTAVWTGAPLDAVLDAYGAETGEGTWLSVVGADAPAGEDAYCRSVPMGKVRRDCLLAYEMNGLPLTPEHGHPVRLLVPGWFGNNSVKWVDRLHVMDSMVTGEELPAGHAHYHQESYRLLAAGEDDPTYHRTLSETDTQSQMNGEEVDTPYFLDQLPKSVVTSPTDGVSLDPGPVTVEGVAWAGEDPVERVDVSTDGGETWSEASLGGSALGRHAWRRFTYRWDAGAGHHVLATRATDADGRTQPVRVAAPDEGGLELTGETYPWNEKGYGNNAYRSYAVSVTVGDATE